MFPNSIQIYKISIVHKFRQILNKPTKKLPQILYELSKSYELLKILPNLVTNSVHKDKIFSRRSFRWARWIPTAKLLLCEWGHIVSPKLQRHLKGKM